MISGFLLPAKEKSMPGGIYDSSKTRVAPVFDALLAAGGDWVSKLLALAEGTPNAHHRSPTNLAFLSGGWGANETALPPPVSLLSWMIRNPDRLLRREPGGRDRELLLRGNPEATGRALDLLRRQSASRDWYIFEGPTVPDAYIQTPDALIVIEGKRTEAGPTTDTTWLVGRHQIWRHIDAAWERRARRRVFGLFIVEGTPRSGDVPAVWRHAVKDALSPGVIASSFPHRSPEERMAISSCFIGVTTWQRIVSAFNLAQSTLIERIVRA